MKGRSRFRFRYRGIMGALAQSLSNLFDKILADEETAGNANVFYDPQDLTSLRVGTDGSGGVPVVGDPVGMMLDTSPTGSQTMEQFIDGQPELVTNGTFDTDASGWTGINATLSSSSGELVVTSTVAGTCWAQQDIAVTSGSSYLVSVDHKISGISQDLFLGSSTGVADLHNGPTQGSDTTEVVLVTATSSVLSITLRVFSSSIGQTGGLDNVTVKEIPGHHAIAPTDAARPLLYDEFDTSLASLTDDGTRGEELVTNGTFDTDVSGWTADTDTSISFASGSMRVELISGTNPSASAFISTEIGETYEFQVEITGGTQSGWRYIRVGTGAFGSNVAEFIDKLDGTSLTVVFQATATTTYITVLHLTSTVGQYLDYDNISVRKVNTAFDERGDELVTNGTFDTDTDWTLGTGWTVSGGKLNSATGSSVASSIPLTFSAGKAYRVSFTVSNYVSGQTGIRLRDQTFAVSTSVSAAANGVYTGIIVGFSPTGSTFLDVTRSFTNVDLSIDNISVKEVLTPNLLLTSAGDDDSTFDTDTGNWDTTNAGWSIGSGVLSCDGTAFPGNTNIDPGLVQNRWYLCRMYISAISGGQIRFNAAGTAGTFFRDRKSTRLNSSH